LLLLLDIFLKINFNIDFGFGDGAFDPVDPLPVSQYYQLPRTLAKDTFFKPKKMGIF
jgi:hypothetical protein